jgi:hypothetical protein
LNDRPRLAKVVAEELQVLLLGNEINPTNKSIAPPLAEAALLEFLNGTQGRREIETALATLNRMGIHSIPKFIIGGRTLVDGAAESETFIRIFREIEKAGKLPSGDNDDNDDSPATVFGDILGVAPEIIQRGSHSRNPVPKV